MDSRLVNENPIVYPKKQQLVRANQSNTDEYSSTNHIRDIKDPEHSELTLEDLRVITKESVEVDDAKSYVRVTLTPTLPHCHVPHLIGLCIYAKLLKSLPTRFKVDVRVAPGSHATEAAVNKQLGDKERIAAAIESPYFVDLFN
ncbi:protein AE7-like 2 [Brassica rapa]|uniref:protein AE7-like 2 n=1 Tax=Brassica campestris TaxID=3711 RepID=UPI00142E891C|nr:protein AE7-like 2 [Brassica rapa]